MPYHVYPLRYAIDNWHQASNAKSNTDPTLRIRVSDFINSDILIGVRLQVTHPQYGILFSCLTRAEGRLIDSEFSGMTTEQILNALGQLGFDIRFKEHPRVTANTLAFLRGALECGYTHVRWITKTTYGIACGLNTRSSTKIVICFNAVNHPELVKQYVPPIENFGGDIMEVSPNDNPNLDFSWLSVPMEIQSILNNG